MRFTIVTGRQQLTVLPVAKYASRSAHMCYRCVPANSVGVDAVGGHRRSRPALFRVRAVTGLLRTVLLRSPAV
jgi:hypothetical protein